MKSWNKFGFFGIICWLLVSSCQAGYDKVLPETNKFFDLKAYFQEEKVRLEKISKFVKTTTIDKQEETHQLDALPLENELQIFENSDINRIAWFDKYGVDSLISGNQLNSIHYKALDPKLKTQKIVIDFNTDAVSKITITNISSSTILASSQILSYQPSTGYTIQSKQKMLFSEEKEILVNVRFNP